jgi:hypothetical protein
MMRRLLPVMIVLASFPAAATAGKSEPSTHWIHVKVDQKAPEVETVRINLPVRLAAEILPMIQDGRMHGGLVRLDSLGTQGDVDLRGMLAALEGAEDGEYVTVDSPDEKVRIQKRDGQLLIKVEEFRPEPQTVDIKVRMDVLKAMLSCPPGELNVSAALAVLGSDEAELVAVQEQNETVRIWVDRKPTAD